VILSAFVTPLVSFLAPSIVFRWPISLISFIPLLILLVFIAVFCDLIRILVGAYQAKDQKMAVRITTPQPSRPAGSVQIAPRCCSGKPVRLCRCRFSLFKLFFPPCVTGPRGSSFVPAGLNWFCRTMPRP
jgi:hypothetical protein